MKSSRISSTRAPDRNNVFLWLAVLCVLSAVLSICLGSVRISPGEVLAALFGGTPRTAEAQIVLYARLPRTCGCLAAGAALAVSGAVIQSVLSNPLAAPNIIGVNAGAGLAVALCSAWFPSAVGIYPLCAFAGALTGVLLVLVIAKKTKASKMTLVLSGVAVSSVFSALIDAVITFVPDALNGYSDFRIGGFSNLSMARVLPSLWVILPALVLLLSLAGEMDILALGAGVAKSLGLNTELVQIVVLALAAALAGAAVSFAGLLGFVGLIVPHIVRNLLGENNRPLIVGTALGGAAMLTFCDTVSRLLFAPYELPVGVMLSVIGGPFFIWLLIRQRGGRLYD